MTYPDEYDHKRIPLKRQKPPGECKTLGCREKRSTRGWCAKHYWERHQAMPPAARQHEGALW